MFKRLFGLGRSRNRTVALSLYEQIVAAARQPALYAEIGVPDTPLGRFEMLSLHVFLFMHRVRTDKGAIADMTQDLTDEFFLDVDHSLRELGIGDMGVPKRMKKLARMFYGRTAAYGAALDAGDRDALEAALRRNVVPDDASWTGAPALAAYVFAADRALGEMTAEEFLRGEIRFGAPRAPETKGEET